MDSDENEMIESMAAALCNGFYSRGADRRKEKQAKTQATKAFNALKDIADIRYKQPDDSPQARRIKRRLERSQNTEEK